MSISSRSSIELLAGGIVACGIPLSILFYSAIHPGMTFTGFTYIFLAVLICGPGLMFFAGLLCFQELFRRSQEK